MWCEESKSIGVSIGGLYEMSLGIVGLWLVSVWLQYSFGLVLVVRA